MNTNFSLPYALATSALLMAGLTGQQALADNLTARSVMLTIDLPSIINPVYDAKNKTCIAWVEPQGRIASERAIYIDRPARNQDDKKGLQSILSYGFAMDNFENPNNTNVWDLTVVLTGRAGNRAIKPVIQSEGFEQNENNELFVELLDENREIDFLYLGANGADGDKSILTSSDGRTYNPNCNQENRTGNPPGVKVKDIQNGLKSSCRGGLRDTSLSNNDLGGDLVTYTGASIPLAPGAYTVSVTGLIKSVYDDDGLRMAANKTIRVNNCQN